VKPIRVGSPESCRNAVASSRRASTVRSDARYQPTKEIQRTLSRLAVLWHVPRLKQGVAVQFSPRLKRSVGRTLPKSGIIRLHFALGEPKYRRLLRTALCHEAAHVAAQMLYGSQVRPHGPEWHSLVRMAGHQPSRTVAWLELSPPKASIGRRRGMFRYFCPVCQAVYLCRKRDARLRCGPCLKTGLTGSLHSLHQ
jgi:predicted SprT family Zn-dependent metalloprotease